MRKKYRVPRRYSEVGKYLKELRKVAGLTQREVSLKLGYSSPQFISNFEQGIALPPLKKMKVLQELYGGNAESLVEVILRCERRAILAGLGHKGK